MSSTLSPELSALQTKIDAGTAHIGIYGLGYVGLPLALRFAEVGLKVTGFDIDRGRCNHYLRPDTAESLS